MRYLLPLVILFSFTTAWCQPYLKPSIGLASMPAGNSSICPIPVYLGNYYASGYHLHDTIPDFTLYTVNGTEVNMQSVLQSGKPVLLVAGSYTCPEFRYRVQDLNDMAAFYNGLLKIIVVYVVEAHPDNAICPYTGAINVTNYNIADNVLYHQPTSYGQRVAMVDTMNAHITLAPLVLIDGPCNEWWSHFGPAPNNAYLVDPNGIVVAKNGWYNYNTENMWCSIDSLLGTNSGHCTTQGGGGDFEFTMLQDSVVSGIAGDVLTVEGKLKNLSALKQAYVAIYKDEINVPGGWETALCTDICLPANIDTTHLTIPPGDSQNFTFYFYTSPVPGAGNGRITFKNPVNLNNIVKQRYFGSTDALSAQTTRGKKDKIKVFPNPATDHIYLKFPVTSSANCVLMNAEGEVMREETCHNCSNEGLNTNGLSPGTYVIKITGDKWTQNKKIVIR